MNVYVFIGRFKSEEDSLSYSQEVWESEPDDSVSDEEYQQWEDNNPTWKLANDLGLYLDSDFIETINGEDKFDYLKSIVEESEFENILHLQQELGIAESTMVLIFEEAIHSEKFQMKSTEKIDFKGKFKSTD